MAAELAASLKATLMGLFVEDVDLIRVAGLPFAKVVGSFSRSLRAMDLEELERQLRVQARLMQERLLEAARRGDIPWDFRVVRGTVGPAILSAATDTDLLILGKIGRSITAYRRMGSTARMIVHEGPGLTLIFQQERVSEVSVSVIYDGSELADKGVHLAQKIARARKGALKLFIIAEDEPSAQRLHRQAVNQLKDSNLEVEPRLVINQRLEGLVHILQLEARGLVILPCDQRQKEDLCWLVNQIPRPVLLIR
jgi:nucleotide-binding universal stress UspA family protein